MADKPVAEVVNVDAVIDALAPSPTSSDVYEATLPFNPHAVAASAVRRAGEGGGGGFSPVRCYLSANAVPVATEAQHPALWDQLQDDPWNGNILGAIPVGLGMTFAFDGSDATITTTEDGFWALTLIAEVASDATFQGRLRDSFFSRVTIPPAATGISATASIGATYSMPDGTTFNPLIETDTAGIGTVATFGLVIVRFG